MILIALAGHQTGDYAFDGVWELEWLIPWAREQPTLIAYRFDILST